MHVCAAKKMISSPSRLMILISTPRMKKSTTLTTQNIVYLQPHSIKIATNMLVPLLHSLSRGSNEATSQLGVTPRRNSDGDERGWESDRSYWKAITPTCTAKTKE